MNVTIASESVPFGANLPDGTLYLRVVYLKGFLSSDGEFIGSSDFNPLALPRGWEVLAACTKAGTNVLTPSVTVVSTEDALDGDQGRLVGQIVTADNLVLFTFPAAGGMKVPASPASTTWERLVLYNAGVPVSPPAAPSIAVTAPHDFRGHVVLTPSPGATSYSLQRRAGAGGYTPILDHVPASTFPYDDDALTATTTYTYRATAHNSWGDSPWSDERTITTPAAEGTPALAADGNSLTRGYGASNPPTTSYPARLTARLAAAGGNYAVSNLGADGQTFPDMSSDAAAQVDVLKNSSSTHNIVIAWEITNCIGNAGDDAATALAHAEAYIDARVAAGWNRVIVPLALPRDDAAWSPSKETIRQAVNAQLTSHYSGSSVVEIVDLSQDSRLSDPHDSTYFNLDKIHLNDNGYDVVAELLAARVLAYNPPVTYSIKGTILDGSGSPVASADVALTGDTTATVTTDSAGKFTFPSVARGFDVVITPSKSGYEFTPTTRSVTNITGNLTGKDFTGEALAGITWQNEVGGAHDANNDFVKSASTAWGNCGASSVETITGLGKARTRASATNTDKIFGLAPADTNQNYTEATHGFYMQGDGTCKVWESGVQATGGTGASSFGYADNDTLDITIELVSGGRTVRYYQNGTLRYTSAVAPAPSLRIDVTINTTGARIKAPSTVGFS